MKKNTVGRKLQYRNLAMSCDDGFSSDEGGRSDDKGCPPLTEVVELLQKAMADGAVETALKAAEGFETLESCTFAEDGSGD